MASTSCPWILSRSFCRRRFVRVPLLALYDILYLIYNLPTIAHMQTDKIVGRCNREFDFHRYDLDNVKDEYDECDDDSLQELQLEDIIMPEQFEMLRDAKDHTYNFDSTGK